MQSFRDSGQFRRAKRPRGDREPIPRGTTGPNVSIKASEPSLTQRPRAIGPTIQRNTRHCSNSTLEDRGGHSAAPPPMTDTGEPLDSKAKTEHNRGQSDEGDGQARQGARERSGDAMPPQGAGPSLFTEAQHPTTELPSAPTDRRSRSQTRPNVPHNVPRITQTHRAKCPRMQGRIYPLQRKETRGFEPCGGQIDGGLHGFGSPQGRALDPKAGGSGESLSKNR